MSVKLSSYVWDGCAASGIKDTKLLVMVRLADWCNDDGVCWPSVETIARQTGSGISTVRTAIGELEKLGWLSRQQRRKGNRNASNVYQLNVAKLRDAAVTPQPPASDPSKSERSESDASKFDGSKSDASESGKNSEFDPPESGGDPSVNSKHDPSDKNTFGQPPAAADRGGNFSDEIHITDQAILVLRHLNQITGARYTTGKSTLENIRARLVDGHTVDELKTVVEFMADRWLGTEWSKHLTPPTIFHPAKFPANLLGAQAWIGSGRKQGTEPVDTAERDAAYRRFIGSGNPLKNPSQLELTVKAEASKAGVRGMRADFAVTRWNGIWKDCAGRTSGGKAA